MGWFSWLLLAIATVIAAMIVDKLNISNWFMIPILLVVWLASYVLIWVFNLAVYMLPFVIIGAALWYVLSRKS